MNQSLVLVATRHNTFIQRNKNRTRSSSEIDDGFWREEYFQSKGLTRKPRCDNYSNDAISLKEDLSNDLNEGLGKTNATLVNIGIETDDISNVVIAYSNKALNGSSYNKSDDFKTILFMRNWTSSSQYISALELSAMSNVGVEGLIFAYDNRILLEKKFKTNLKRLIENVSRRNLETIRSMYDATENVNLKTVLESRAYLIKKYVMQFEVYKPNPIRLIFS